MSFPLNFLLYKDDKKYCACTGTGTIVHVNVRIFYNLLITTIHVLFKGSLFSLLNHKMKKMCKPCGKVVSYCLVSFWKLLFRVNFEVCKWKIIIICVLHTSPLHNGGWHPPPPLRTAYRSFLALCTAYRHFLASCTAHRLTTKNNHFGRFHLHKVKITVCCMHMYSNSWKH